MKRIIRLLLSHGFAVIVGFAAGIYTLPILTAPDAPSELEVKMNQDRTKFQGQFVRDLKGSDVFHWGDGRVDISDTAISLIGEIAPGPDYKLYLSPKFVENEDEFEKIKSKMVQVGDVKTFNNFIVTLPESIDPTKYNTVIVWCESFGEFITAAKYKEVTM